MKKITLILLGVFTTLTLAAQPPMRPQGQRPQPNQFRDFVDHQQRLEMERPKIEKKDGKVIITMSEEQFRRMQMMKREQRIRFSRYQQNQCCDNCHKRPMHRIPGRRI